MRESSSSSLHSSCSSSLSSLKFPVFTNSVESRFFGQDGEDEQDEYGDTSLCIQSSLSSLSLKTSLYSVLHDNLDKRDSKFTVEALALSESER